MTQTPAADIVERGLAQYWFEIGYGSCWADAYMANGYQAPFLLTDSIVEHAWSIAPEATDDPDEFQARLTEATEVEALRRKLDEAEKALHALEMANEELAAVRTVRTYHSIVQDGAEELLLGLDNARAEARKFLASIRGETE